MGRTIVWIAAGFVLAGVGVLVVTLWRAASQALNCFFPPDERVSDERVSTYDSN